MVEIIENRFRVFYFLFFLYWGGVDRDGAGTRNKKF